MSMAKKIYGIIALLIVVALVIAGVSIWGLREVNTSAGQLGNLAKRSLNLNTFNEIGLNRSIGLLRTISTTDPEMLKQLQERYMDATEKQMTAEMADYKENIELVAATSAPEVLERPQRVQALWDDFLKVSNEAVEIALINSNAQALEMASSMNSFWDSTYQTIEEIVQSIPNTAAENVVTWRGQLRNARADIVQYRLSTVQLINATDPEISKNLERSARGSMDKVVATFKAGESLPSPYAEKAVVVSNLLKDKAMPVMEEVLRLGNINSGAQALIKFRNEVDPAFEKLNEYTGSLIADARVNQDKTIAYTVQLGATVITTATVVSGVGIILAGILAWITISRITGRLTAIIAGLGEASMQVNSAAGHISAASQSLAEGATEQAASLEETSSALEEMASMTRQNADNATKTNTISEGNNQKISVGSSAVQNMSQAMSEISDSSEKISHIVKTIEEIAFQTNLLALNAAVEAARAGEAGKGFAVVADEVRNLAGRSAQAARDTTELIEGTVSRVQNGSSIAVELGESFKEIEEGSRTVSHLVSEITAATNEQAQGVDQVNTAVAQMDKVTQSNAASAEESASAAEELSAQASQLDGMVQDLVDLVRGEKAAASASAAAGRGSKKRVVQVREFESMSAASSVRPASAKGRAMKMLPGAAAAVIPLGEEDDF